LSQDFHFGILAAIHHTPNHTSVDLFLFSFTRKGAFKEREKEIVLARLVAARELFQGKSARVIREYGLNVNVTLIP
jgi:hypothetical protein